MKILDRYILRFFFSQLFLWYITLTGLYLILDIFPNYDSYMNIEGERSGLEVFGIHYYYICLSFIDIVLPLLIVMVAIRTLVFMIGRNEVIALLGMGVSELRIIMPILVGSVLLSCGSLYLREYYIPQNMTHIIRSVQEEASPSEGIAVKQTTDGFTKIRIGGERYFADRQEIKNPTIALPVLYFGLSVSEIKAERAVYLPATEKRSGGFMLEKVSKPDGLPNEPTITIPETGQPVILTHADYPDWIPDCNCFAISGINPRQLEIGRDWLSLASVVDLVRETANPSSPFSRKDIAVQIHTRVLRPISDLFPVLIALPLVLLRGNRNSFHAMVIGGFWAALYIGTQYAGLFAGSKFNMPIIAAWLPVLLFGPIVFNLFADLRR